MESRSQEKLANERKVNFRSGLWRFQIFLFLFSLVLCSTTSGAAADEELVTGTVEIACVDIGKMAPAPIPEFLHRKLEALK